MDHLQFDNLSPEPNMAEFELGRARLRLEELESKVKCLEERELQASRQLFTVRHELLICKDRVKGLELQTEADGQDIVHLHDHLEKARMFACILHAELIAPEDGNLRQSAREFAENMGWPDMVSEFSVDTTVAEFIRKNAFLRSRLGRWT